MVCVRGITRGKLGSVVVLAAAVVPHPPLLVPDLAAGAAGLVAPLLAACDTVVARLLDRRPRLVVLIGSGSGTRTWSDRDTGTFGGFGGPSGRTGLGTTGLGTAGVVRSVGLLPLSLSIGRWLLARAGWADGPVLLQEVAASSSVEDCRRLAVLLAAEAGPEAVWLVLGDGSNRRGPRSPGHDDPRAAGFDAGTADAFATGDPIALLGLDPGLATELGAAGRPVWQVLAAAVAADPGWPEIDASVHYDDAPFGVEYLVADWAPRS